METTNTWQSIPTGGTNFNEIWDDTELIKAFSKSIKHYKKMHDPNRKVEVDEVVHEEAVSTQYTESAEDYRNAALQNAEENGGGEEVHSETSQGLTASHAGPPLRKHRPSKKGRAATTTNFAPTYTADMSSQHQQQQVPPTHFPYPAYGYPAPTPHMMPPIYAPAPHCHHHPSPHGWHCQPPPPPPLPAGIDDQALQDLLQAWYYSGYYAGRYQAMKYNNPH